MLVAALTREAATTRVQAWLDHEYPDGLMTSDRVVTEFVSALSVKIRMNQLSIEDRAKAAGFFTRLREESLMVVPVTRDHF